MIPRVVFFSGLLALAACSARDTTITDGAEGARDWSRRLTAAVPLGTSRDSAAALLTANGFQCSPDPTRAATLWCDKRSGGRLEIVRRRWQALLTLDTLNRVAEVKGTTALIGP